MFHETETPWSINTQYMYNVWIRKINYFQVFWQNCSDHNIHKDQNGCSTLSLTKGLQIIQPKTTFGPEIAYWCVPSSLLEKTEELIHALLRIDLYEPWREGSSEAVFTDSDQEFTNVWQIKDAHELFNVWMVRVVY